MINYGYRLRMALRDYAQMRGFDIHGPNVEQVFFSICADLDETIDSYIQSQQAGELND